MTVRSLAAALAASAALAACGGTSSGSSGAPAGGSGAASPAAPSTPTTPTTPTAPGTTGSSTAPLDPGFVGQWSGVWTVKLPGYKQLLMVRALPISAGEQRLAVWSPCLDGTGQIDATGSGTGATWEGSLACPSFQIGACPTLQFTIEAFSVTLTGPGSLTATSVGTATGCGATYPFAFTFSGAK